jgi:hypothetical protein
MESTLSVVAPQEGTAAVEGEIPPSESLEEMELMQELQQRKGSKDSQPG